MAYPTYNPYTQSGNDPRYYKSSQATPQPSAWQKIRQGAGNAVEALGAVVAPWAPDTGVSEWIAGGPTRISAGAVGSDYATGQSVRDDQPQSSGVSGSWETSGGGSGGGADIINRMVSQGGYDRATAEQVYGADPGRFESEFGGHEAELLRQQQQEADNYYNEIIASLDKMAGLYEVNRGDWEKRIEDLYSSQLAGIESERGLAGERMEKYRGDVKSQQEKTLQDLSSDMRNALRAGQIRLGGAGAGASSAVPMYSYALAKQTNKRRADIKQQTAEMLNELNIKQEDVKNTFVQQQEKLKQWKIERLGQVQDDHIANLAQIESLRGKAGEDREKRRMAALQDAIGRLRELEDQAMSWEQLMANWARERMVQLDDYKIKIGELSQFSPRKLTYQELQQAPSFDTGGRQFNPMAYNPYSERKEEFGEIVNNLWR